MLCSNPFNVRIPGQISGGQGYWVGQGAPKPLTKFDFQSVQLGVAKVANIAVLTDELVRFSNPASVTNGVTAIPSTGNPEADVEALFEAFLKANLSPRWCISVCFYFGC
ncbi:hypothetical protein ABMZ73_13570 [Morganella morganii]|uniref:hypothetical protein n=1 Tax=Morganella morganii TaxID=582 RepID=UPI003EB962F0